MLTYGILYDGCLSFARKLKRRLHDDDVWIERAQISAVGDWKVVTAVKCDRNLFETPGLAAIN